MMMTKTTFDARPCAAFAKCLDNFRPPENLTVDEWADKYRILPASSAEAGPWRTSRTPYLREPMRAFTDPNVQRIVMVASSQVGKALDIQTPIPTPEGWLTMESLQAGDRVFDENGNPCNVVKVTEIMHGRPCYRLTFSDGSKITADAEHQWRVDDGKEKRILTTREIASTFKTKQGNRYAIGVCGALELPAADLPIKPYTLGVWLGDGHAYSNQFCGHVDDLEIVEGVKADGYRVKIESHDGKIDNYVATIEPRAEHPGECIRGHILKEVGLTRKGLCAECARQHAKRHQRIKRGLTPSDLDPIKYGHGFFSDLKEAGLLKNKHIPAVYLRASKAQRLALLQGLMDTDGTCDKRGRCEIILKSRRLIEDVSEILHSLGIKHNIKAKRVFCTNSPTHAESAAYRISFIAYSDLPVFRLKRKKARQPDRSGVGPCGKPRRITETERRRIVNVEAIDSVPVKCIQVDSASRLYLAGREMIPTHNSELELNIIGYIIAQDPGSILYIQPSEGDAKKFSRQRIAPMIRACKQLRGKVSDVKSRDSGNTILQKMFPGGSLTLTGSNSAPALASMPIRYVLGDERDRWADSAGTEGDPWELAQARQITFYNRKSVEVSTPTIKGSSKIEESFSQGTQERWMHQCPHCGEYNEINFETVAHRVKKEQRGVREVIDVEIDGFACPACGCITPQDVMRKQPAKWVADNPEAYKSGCRSFWLTAFASPWVEWRSIMLDVYRNKDNPEKLKVVYNTKLGKLWEHRDVSQTDEELMSRLEEYPAELPDGVLCLTCGVDTQDDRLEYEVVGWGKNGESWGIKKGYIMGAPDFPATWERLDDVIDRVYKFQNGQALQLGITLVDSGGHFTQTVYEECRKRQVKKVFAIKGRGGEGVPIVNPPKRVAIRDNKRVTCWLYSLGVDAGKAIIYANVQVQTPGPRYCHFPKGHERGYDINFFNGLISERMVRRKTAGGYKWVWEKLPGHRRNEALDCRNYALAGLKIIDPDFDALALRLKKLAEAPAVEVEIEKKPKPPKRKRRELYDEW